jgi:N-sulfoglucosamine sulfohydrolase
MVSSRRGFLKSVAATAGGVAFTGGLPAVAAFGRVNSFTNATSRPRPNILYINSHDTGRFTSPYGYDVPTPNLQRLAQDGVCFLQAHCAAPTCSASRASLLTGECSHNNGMLGLVNRGFKLNDYQHHIIHTLRNQAGYYTALVGLQHVAPHSSMIGYDHVQNIPGDHVEQVAPAAVEFLRNHPKQPFWLEVGFFETHRPYREATSQDNPKHILPPGPIPNVPETRMDMANFHASAQKMDWGVGQVLAALEAAGLAENTLVISATDHGIAFPDMKANLYDGGTGVHFVMRGPGGFEGGRICDALISHIDVFATLCDLLQIQPPSWLQGKSFLPVLRGEVEEINDAVYAELNYHSAYEPKRSVRTTQWKYIRHYSTYPHPTLPNCDDGPSKTYWIQNGWGKQMIADEELFDLTFDPNERNNLVFDPSHHEVLEEMRQKLHGWMESTSDPLLKGPVPAPPGARVNAPNQTSPRDPDHIIT